MSIVSLAPVALLLHLENHPEAVSQTVLWHWERNIWSWPFWRNNCKKYTIIVFFFRTISIQTWPRREHKKLPDYYWRWGLALTQHELLLSSTDWELFKYTKVFGLRSKKSKGTSVPTTFLENRNFLKKFTDFQKKLFETKFLCWKN